MEYLVYQKNKSKIENTDHASLTGDQYFVNFKKLMMSHCNHMSNIGTTAFELTDSDCS